MNKSSQVMTDLWANPTFRQEVQKKMSDAAFKRWAEPAFKQKMVLARQTPFAQRYGLSEEEVANLTVGQKKTIRKNYDNQFKINFVGPVVPHWVKLKRIATKKFAAKHNLDYDVVYKMTNQDKDKFVRQLKKAQNDITLRNPPLASIP